MADRRKADGEKQLGKGGILMPLVILTVLGIGFGTVFKLYVLGPTNAAPKSSAEAKTHAKKTPDKYKTAKRKQAHDEVEMADTHGEVAAEPFILGVDPVVTTLAGGVHSWVRLEVSLIFGKKPKESLKLIGAQISNDLVAYLRTVKASQLEGAEGLEYLTDDLNDIVRTRTHGAADRLVVKGLVVE